MEPSDVTALLLNWNEGSQQALDRLMPLVEEELKQRARRQFRNERGDHTLQPTALVNELYLRLLDRRQASWQSRVHFFAFASRVMRRILVDHARAHEAGKRGGGAMTITLEDSLALVAGAQVDLLALDQALDRLSELDADQARIVELRFFGGLSVEDTAEILDLSTATVKREWASAKAWLRREMAQG